MRIVVDVSPLSHPRTGIGNYIRGSLQGLVTAAHAAGHEVVAFAPTSLHGPRQIREALAGIPVETRLLPLPASHAIRTAWSRSRRVSLERIIGRTDAFVFTDWMYPPQRGGLRATVFHDLVPFHHPEWCTPRTVSMHTHKAHDAVRTCDVLFANSAFTGRDVVETLGAREDAIVVAHPGLGPGLSPDGSRFELGGPTVLGVGTIEPRKNLARLVEAWRGLGDEVGLALVGGEGWGDRPDLADERILRLGFVPDARLGELYRGAAVLVYPSLFEGFGLPPIEAMACGTPVVASAHPSLDEACGDAAVRVDPLDPSAIAAGVHEALDRRDDLVERGLRHAARFTWERTGRAMLEAFEARW